MEAINYKMPEYLLNSSPGNNGMFAKFEKEQSLNLNTVSQVDFILDNIKKKQPQFSRIALQDQETLVFVNVKDIIRCEAIAGHTNVYTCGGKKFLCPKSINKYEELLPVNLFFRIHSAHLINLNLIKKYFKGRGGYVEMEDGAMIEVSYRRKDGFLACFSF